MKIKVDNFSTAEEALNFINELKEKNEKCDGKLSNTGKIVTILDKETNKKKEEIEYTWHVKYNADLIKSK